MANQAGHAGVLGIIGLDPDTVPEGSIPLRRFGFWRGGPPVPFRWARTNDVASGFGVVVRASRCLRWAERPWEQLAIYGQSPSKVELQTETLHRSDVARGATATDCVLP